MVRVIATISGDQGTLKFDDNFDDRIFSEPLSGKPDLETGQPIPGC